jgi:hypothetical protein
LVYPLKRVLKLNKGRTMRVELRNIAVPDFGIPIDRPLPPANTYGARCDRLVEQAEADWVVVYADREHLANMVFLTGFEPRFEEALLVLGRRGERFLLCGNESLSYASIARAPNIELKLCQSLSLLGQDRSKHPNLKNELRHCGMDNGQTIGVVGWKYLEPSEWDGDEPALYVPAAFAQILKQVIGASGRLTDCTALLMDPQYGQRSIVDADEIAMLEWGGARASAAVLSIIQGIREGDTELDAASRMRYAGEPLSCHMMLSSSDRRGPVNGLASPSSRRISLGDGVVAAVGYWGGLAARGGLLARDNDKFLAKASAYFKALCAWYASVDIGAAGEDVYATVEDELAAHDLRPALNPGHLISIDEWSNTPIRKKGGGRLASGMPLQVDIIPVPMADGETLNCEDGVVLADEALRRDLRERHPTVCERIDARRAFVRDQIGIDLKASILPLSSMPLCLAPFWLAPNKLLALAREVREPEEG